MTIKSPREKTRKPGEKIDKVVFVATTPQEYFANNPQIVRTEEEIILCFGVQAIDKLRLLETHHHYHPVSRPHWAISDDGGYTWYTTDFAPEIGNVLDASYGEPVSGGGMATITFTLPHLTQYGLIQKGKVGWIPYHSDLPAIERNPVRDLGPFQRFRLQTMTRSPNGSLLAAGYGESFGDAIPLYEAPDYSTTLFLRSEDEGRSWHYLSHIEKHESTYYNECGILSCKNGRVLALLRTDWYHVPKEKRPEHALVGLRGGEKGLGYYLFQVESTDNGYTWSEPVLTPVWGHPPYLLRLQSGSILLVYGHRRPPFSVRAILSHDDGNTWDLKTMRLLHEFNPGSYDIGYPQATQLPDGTIVCCYYGYVTEKVEGRLNPCGIYVSLFDEEWLFESENASE